MHVWVSYLDVTHRDPRLPQAFQGVRPVLRQVSTAVQGKLGSEARAVKASLRASRHYLLGKAGYVLYLWPAPLVKFLRDHTRLEQKNAGRTSKLRFQAASAPFFRGPAKAAPRARGGRGDRGGRGGRGRGYSGYSLGSQQKFGASLLPELWTKVGRWRLTGLQPGDEVEVLQKIDDGKVKVPAHSGTRSLTGLLHETTL